MPSTQDIQAELEEITVQSRAMRENPNQGVRYALQMALAAARLAGASEAQIWTACENPGLCPGVYWSHAMRLADEILVPVDSDLALNHGPYASVVDAYNAAAHNPPGCCIVLLVVGDSGGLIEAHKPSTYGVFEPNGATKAGEMLAYVESRWRDLIGDDEIARVNSDVLWAVFSGSVVVGMQAALGNRADINPILDFCKGERPPSAGTN